MAPILYREFMKQYDKTLIKHINKMDFFIIETNYLMFDK